MFSNFQRDYSTSRWSYNCLILQHNEGSEAQGLADTILNLTDLTVIWQTHRPPCMHTHVQLHVLTTRDTA